MKRSTWDSDVWAFVGALAVAVFMIGLAIWGSQRSAALQRAQQRNQLQALCDLHQGIPVFDTRGDVQCAAVNQPVQSMEVR